MSYETRQICEDVYADDMCSLLNKLYCRPDKGNQDGSHA